MVQLPDSIALPLFRRIYPLVRWMEGSPIPPINRRILPIDPGVRLKFDRLFEDSLSLQAMQPIEYYLPYPKIDFLHYLCDWRGIVAHGTNQGDLEVLEPSRLGRNSGISRQVFCSADAAWALWFAILDRSKIRTTRSGCVGIGSPSEREKFFHFELKRDLKGTFPFSEGTVYLARKKDFPYPHRVPFLSFFGGDFEEWSSFAPVIPLAKLQVKPQDFPYLDQVQYCI